MNNNGRARAKKNDNEGDGISELPESILHHILSFLDLKPAIQTSILSTKWRYVWKSLPFLNFDEDRFYETMFGDLEFDEDFWFGDLGFGDFVDNVLNLRDSSYSIQRFRLFCYKCIAESNFHQRLSKWITSAVESNVQDLWIDVGSRIQLPQCLLNCKSLSKLVLMSFRVEVVNLPDSMNLPGLKTLVLHTVQFKGSDDDILNKIISSCPVLESLRLHHCYFHQPTLDINAPQLEHLVFRHCNRFHYHSKNDLNEYIVKLNAPNLVSFRYDDNMVKDYCLVNLSALVKAEIYMDAIEYDEDENSNLDDEIREVFVQRMFKILRALHNVEDLTLSAWFIEVVSGGLALLSSPSIQFCNLRSLKLEIWHSRDCFNAIAHLLNIFPNVESIFVEIKKVRSDLVKIEGDLVVGTLHRLKFVKILGVLGHLNELQFLEILLKNGMALEKVVIRPPHREGLSREFVQQLLTLPRASSSIEFSVS